MNYYVIGIGGTGAKCIEALTHLCAAGMMPDGELFMLFVDPDRANGNVGRAQTTLQQYIDCGQFELGRVDLFKTRILRANPDVWSPFNIDVQPCLGNFFQYNFMKARNAAAANLFNTLYSSSERDTELDKGFRGHPSIGAAVMATTGLGQVQPWRSFRDRIGNDVKGGGVGARILLCGSVFGGTGASGFPTIARLIRDELKKLGNAAIGGILVMPYFSFIPDDKEELRASSGNFMMNTQVALKYYYQQASTNIYDAVYLLGDESPINVNFSIGGNTQKNDPHFIELFAALAAIDFFKSENPAGYLMIAREQKNQLKWTDLPDGNDGNTIRQKLAQLARFAFAYLSVYYPMLVDIRQNGKGYRAPWFVNLFERQKIALDDSKVQLLLDQMKVYCESFLLWLANVQESWLVNAAVSAGSENLIKHLAFAETMYGKVSLKIPERFTLTDFSNLVLPAKKEDPNALSKLWEYMSDSKLKDENAAGAGKFIHALYRECGR